MFHIWIVPCEEEVVARKWWGEEGEEGQKEMARRSGPQKRTDSVGDTKESKNIWR